MMRRFTAVMLVLAMALGVCGALAEAEVPDTLLVTVNGKEIRENDEELQYYYQTLIDEMADPENEDNQRIARMDAMKEVIQYAVIDGKIAEEISDEEAEKLREEGRQSWATEIEAILEDSYGITEESTEEDRAAALADLLAALEAEYGITEDMYVESFVSGEFSDRVVARMKEEDPSLAASEADIEAAISEYILEERDEVAYYALYMKLSEEDPAKAEEMTDEELDEIYRGLTDEEFLALSNDINAYESVSNYYASYGYDFHYIPEGYRGITHILLDVDEELLNAWLDLEARYEESDEDDGEEAVTAEMVAAAKQAILDSRKETIEEIKGRLEKGENFEDLIAEYGSDPGMEKGMYLETGYPIHKDSISYDAGFTAAAAALEKVGDYSEPVVSRNGIHILFYLRDIPAGMLEVAEEELEQIKQDIEDQNVNLAINNLVDKWVEEADIVWTAEGEAWKEDAAFREAYIDAMYSDEGFDEEEAE